MPNTLTTASTLMCPHGGTVSIIPSNMKAKAGGAPIATSADTFLIAGCPFVTPAAVASPCLTVQWVVSDLSVKAGAATLSQASQGLCLNAAQAPQGPVVINATQPKVSSR